MPAPVDPAPAKAELRRRMRAALRGLSAAERGRRSAAACARLCAAARFLDADVVFAFLSLDWEVDTAGLVEAVLDSGKQLAIPRIDAATRTMAAVRLCDLANVRSGVLGIREPRRGQVLAAEALDLVVAPGLAFDVVGNRLGQGGGYYDRFLADPGLRAPAVGIALDLQIVDSVPAEAHDRPLTAIATDARWVESRRS